MIGAVYGGRYEVTGLLTDSALFQLFSARDRLAGKEVSLRVFRPQFGSEEAFALALEKAAQRSVSIINPGIERMTDVSRDQGTVYIAGDLTRAPSLSDRIRKLAPFSAPVAVSAGISLCKALDALHRAGLVHGDISGDNACLMADGEVRLQVSCLWEAYSSSSAAAAAVLPSMAPYLAPEVTTGGMPSPQSDVYSAGIILYELLTGRRPYTADTALATATKHTSEPTPSAKALNPSVPNVLDEIVKKAMAKHPMERYQSAGELLADLRLMQDALRFGRTLSWPLRQAGAVSTRPTEPQPVAPKMSAIRTEEEQTDRSRKAREERDVPVWMIVSFVFVIAIVASLFGVWFFLNLNRPRMVTVPNLKGLSVQEARVTLQKMHLNLKIGTKIPNDKIEPDRVLEVDPAPGLKVREMGEVVVNVSSGSRTVEVPDLKGISPDKAKSLLGAVNLVMDESIGKVNDPSVPEGSVAKQTPAARTKVSRDTKVTVEIASRDVAAPAKTPDAPVQVYDYSVDVKLTDLEQPVKVKIEMTDDEKTQTLFDETGSPNQSISVHGKGKGKSVKFKIYYDDRVVKEFTQQAGDSTQ